MGTGNQQRLDVRIRRRLPVIRGALGARPQPPVAVDHDGTVRDLRGGRSHRGPEPFQPHHRVAMIVMTAPMRATSPLAMARVRFQGSHRLVLLSILACSFFSSAVATLITV